MADSVLAAVSDEAWDTDDPQLTDSELLFRRVLKRPDHRTYDPELRTFVPSPAAFQRNANEGMSVHMDGVLEKLERSRHTLYNSEKYGAVCFEVGVVRRAGAGVLPTIATVEDEPDKDLREAHAEVRPPMKAKDRAYWSGVRDKIIKSSIWVVQN